MNLFEGASVVAAINLINTIVNIYWTVKLKSIQGNGELMRALREQNLAKDEVIKNLTTEGKKKERAIDELMRRKSQYKYQYHQKNISHAKLEGKVEALQEQKPG